jgi:hypothetical protein
MQQQPFTRIERKIYIFSHIMRLSCASADIVATPPLPTAMTATHISQLLTRKLPHSI